MNYDRTACAPKLCLIPILIGLLQAGCTEVVEDPDVIHPPSYQPTNIYRPQAFLPENIRRVAVLPITNHPGDGVADTSRERLAPLVLAELGKTKAFECLPMAPEQLKLATGRLTLTAEEPLPPKLLQEMSRTWGCDAILFCRLTTYKPYPPLSVGWSFKLVSCADARILWSADEILDAGEVRVAAGARRYYLANLQHQPRLSDSRQILNTPDWFTRYVLYTLFATLPAR